MNLVRYDAARKALAEARAVDEVKDIRDKAAAMAAYARQAKDQEMVQWATEIKVRAELKCGALLREAAENGERATRESPKASGKHVASSDMLPAPTLSDMGISRDQSSRWQKLAAMPEEHFETAVATAKEHAGQVTTAFLLRAASAMAEANQDTELSDLVRQVNEQNEWSAAQRKSNRWHFAHDPYGSAQRFGTEISTAIEGVQLRIRFWQDRKAKDGERLMIMQDHLTKLREQLAAIGTFLDEVATC